MYIFAFVCFEAIGLWFVAHFSTNCMAMVMASSKIELKKNLYVYI